MVPTVQYLQETFVVLAYFAFLFSLFLILSHLVNKRLTISTYTTLQSTAIVIYSIPFSFFLIKAKETVCYDEITPSTGQSNRFCMAQGVLFVLGFHSMVLSLVVRVFSIYMLIVWSRTIPRIYPTIIALGVPSAFAAASGKYIEYSGGVFCAPSPSTTKALLQLPMMIYSSVGLLLSLGTTISVTKTLVSVRINIKKAQLENYSFSSMPFREKLQHVFISYCKSARLLWRTYFTSLFLGSVMVYITIQYTIYAKSRSIINDQLATPDWVSCILTGASEVSCRKYLRGESLYIRTLTTVILLFLFAILFLMTEYRFFLFLAWIKILRHPSALFNKQKSNQILDTLDDARAKFWLPEKFQNSFLGPIKCKYNSECTQVEIERQLVAFSESHQKQKLEEQRQQNEILKKYPEFNFMTSHLSQNGMVCKPHRTSISTAAQSLDSCDISSSSSTVSPKDLKYCFKTKSLVTSSTIKEPESLCFDNKKQESLTVPEPVYIVAQRNHLRSIPVVNHAPTAESKETKDREPATTKTAKVNNQNLDPENQNETAESNEDSENIDLITFLNMC